MISKESSLDTLWSRSRRVVAVLGVAATVTMSGACTGPRELPDAADTYEIPVHPPSPELDIRSIFTERTVGDDPLAVAEDAKGACAINETTRDADSMYLVSTEAVESLLAAISVATPGLDQARESGALLEGEHLNSDGTPSGATVYIMTAPFYNHVTDSESQQFMQVGSGEAGTGFKPGLILLDYMNPNTETDQGTSSASIFLYLERESDESRELHAGCVPHWVGNTYNTSNDGNNQVRKFDDIADLISGATNFRIGNVPLAPAGPSIELV